MLPRYAPPAIALKGGRQSDENQTGTAAGIDMISKACRKNDQTGYKSDDRIQDNDIQTFRYKRMILVDVASENRKGPDTETEREEACPSASKMIVPSE